MKHSKTLLALVVLIIAVESIATGLLPISRGHLFSLFELKAGPIWTALFFYFINYLILDFCQCFKGFSVLKLALWYRTIRTQNINNELIDTNVDNNLYNDEDPYPLSLPSNTPQRIQEDIKLSYLQRITVWVEYVISGLILVQLFLLNLSQPLLVAFAATYAVISVFIAARFNPRLTKAEINIQEAEASYRSQLVSSVTDISGLDVANKVSLKSKWIQTEYLLFTKLQLGLIAVLPYAVLLPQLLSGTIGLGTMIEHQATFALIVVNAAVLIQLYPMLIQGQASEKRVKEIK
jgi:ABC-type uncharacterized transport system fused permease/ATPase subunit